MRALLIRPFATLALLATGTMLCAQSELLRIVSPKAGEAVVGKVMVEVERKSESQSYLVFKINGEAKTAQASNHYEIDTRQYKDGDLLITVDYHDATGKRTATQDVTVKVSNKVAPEEAGIRQEGLLFRHYTAADTTRPTVRRYLLTATGRANAVTVDEESGKPSPDDDGSADAQYAGALDINIALLLRQEVKDLHGDWSAVVKTIVQSGSEQVREGAQSTGGMGGDMGGEMGGGMGGGEMGGMGEGGGGASTKRAEKPPWLGWEWSSEVGKWTIKKISPAGWPIVATHQDQWPYDRQNAFVLADTTPAMPDRPVKPGESWYIPVNPTELPRLYDVAIQQGYDGLDYVMRNKWGRAPRAFVVPNLSSREVYQAIEEQKFLDIERRRWFAYEQGTDRVTPAVRETLVARLESKLHLLPVERVQEKFRQEILDGKPCSPAVNPEDAKRVEKEIRHDLCRQLDEGSGGGQGGGEMMGGGDMGDMGGGEGGGMAGGMGGGGDEAGGDEGDDDPIKEADVDIRRITYFDYENQRVLRIEDLITIVYVTEGGGQGGMGGGEMGGMGGGEMGGMMGGMGGMGGEMGGMGGEGGGDAGQQQASTLTKVTYRARIVTDADAWPTIPTAAWDRSYRHWRSAEADRFQTFREVAVAHDFDNVPKWDDHLPPAWDPRQPDIR